MKAFGKIACAVSILISCSTVAAAQSSPIREQKEQIQKRQAEKLAKQRQDRLRTTERMKAEAERAALASSASKLCSASWERELWSDATLHCTNGANLNDSVAQYILGLQYLKGLGVTKNTDKSVFWLEKSLKNENSPQSAAFDLAHIYYSEEYGIKNIDKSIEFATHCLESCDSSLQIRASDMLDNIYLVDNWDKNKSKIYLDAKIKNINIYDTVKYYISMDNTRKYDFFKDNGINLYYISSGTYTGTLRFVASSSTNNGQYLTRGCYIIEYSSNRNLDELMCNIIKGKLGYVSGKIPIEFAPALDESGNAVDSGIEWRWRVKLTL